MLTENEKNIMISLLRTLIYNNFNDLEKKYKEMKQKLSQEANRLLIYGDESINYGNNTFNVISDLEYRWCLQSVLQYHLTKTLKVTKNQYDSFFKI